MIKKFIKNFKFQISNFRNGFTLIEVVLIVAIVAVVCTVTIVSALKYRASQDLRLTLNELSALIRDVQRKSVTQEDGKRWGIRFENSESGKDRVYLFKGTSFASGTVTQSVLLRRGVQLGEPGSSSTRDVVFLPIEGSISPNKVITLNTGMNDGLFGDIIVNLLGRVTTRTDSGLVGYWHFDEGVGTSTVDASGRGMNGTLNGPTWTSGTNCKSGGCLSFDGDDDFVNIGNYSYLSLRSNLSIFAWVKSSDTAASFVSWGSEGTGGIANGYYGIGSFFGTGKQYAYLGGSWRASESAVYDGSWHYVGFTLSTTGDLQFYKDGVPDGAPIATGSQFLDAPSNSFVIGKDDPSTITFPALAVIDELRLYNRVLSAQEVLNIYNDLK